MQGQIRRRQQLLLFFKLAYGQKPQILKQRDTRQITFGFVIKSTLGLVYTRDKKHTFFLKKTRFFKKTHGFQKNTRFFKKIHVFQKNTCFFKKTLSFLEKHTVFAENTQFFQKKHSFFQKSCNFFLSKHTQASRAEKNHRYL